MTELRFKKQKKLFADKIFLPRLNQNKEQSFFDSKAKNLILPFIIGKIILGKKHF